VICVDRAGRLGAAHTTETMSVGAGRIVDGTITVDAWLRAAELTI
jgi:hypothetical protein